MLALQFVPSHVNEGTDPRRQPRRHPVGRPRRSAGARDQLRARCRARARSRRPRRRRAGRRGRVRAPAAPRPNPLYDLHVAGRRTFWVAAPRRDHRVRLVDGRDVPRPAVPAERARVLAARRRAPRSSPRRRSWCWSRLGRRSSSIATARRFTLLLGYAFCLLGFLDDAAALEGGQPLPRDRGRVRADRDRCRASPGRPRRSRSPARCRCVGPAWRRAPPTCSATSAAPSCSRSSARCSRPGTPRPSHGDRAVAEREQDDRPRRRRRSRSRSRARPTSRSSIPSTPTRSSPPPRTSFVDGQDWAYMAGTSRSARRRAGVLPLPEARRRAAAAARLPRSRCRRVRDRPDVPA